MSWIDEHQADGDEATYLDRIKSWQERAQEAATRYTSAATKKALEDEPPRDDEARALYHLYALHAETVYHVCRQELERASNTEALTLEDVLQESYPRFLRAMVQYDRERGELDLYLAHALRQRVQDYIHSQAEQKEEEQEQEDTAPIAPGFDLPSIYRELKAEGRVPRNAKRLHDTLT